jgi:hypothetical protein
VVNSGKVISGVPIELSTMPATANEDSRVILTVSTDQNGLVAFSGIRPGSYFVAIKSVAFPDSRTVRVDNGSSTLGPNQITFEWPRVKPLSAQSASGLLNAQLRIGKPVDDQLHQIFEPLGDAKLTLLQSTSGDIIEIQKASEAGAFSFRPVPAGLYFLRVEMPQTSSARYYSEDGYIPIEIDPLAKEPMFTLSVFQGMCGFLGFKREGEIVTQ